MFLRALAFFLLTVALYAQSAIIRGQVTDESGAIIPGAVVTVVDARSAKKTATVDERGSYSIAGLPAGDYQVTAAAPQLSTPQSTRVSLQQAPLTVNLILKVVATTQRINVQDETGTALSLDSASNSSGLILKGDDLDALADDPDDLMADLLALAGPAAGPSGGSLFIDGFSGGELPPKASIREIRINQNPFAAEYDKLGYGKIEIFTKPGSDKYHANINYNFATDAWNSRNPFAAVKAPLLLNEFENDGGGPLGKHASFTLDFQRNMVDNGAITNGVMLNSAFIATPFTSVFTVKQRYIKATPRVDYALNEKNTLAMRYSITDSTIPAAGIGNLDLATRAYDFHYVNQTVQLTETAVIGTLINETRFQYFRAAPERNATSSAPEIRVLGAFNDGGASVGHGTDLQQSYEFQNYTTMPHGAHVFKFGVRMRGQTDDNSSPTNFNGTFTFASSSDGVSSIERYRRTVLNLPGGGATQFTINAGTPFLSVGQVDAGIFIADEWRIRPNITVSLGLRYEVQTNISDWRDLAPRIAIAWAPGSKNPKPKTVVRLGFGMFYDRFALANTLTAERYNGVVQQSFVVTDPTFFPNVPRIGSLGGVPSSRTIQELDASLRAPYIIQSALTIERQLPGRSTLAITYTNSHSVHVLRSAVIDFPASPIFLMESSGLYNQNQLIANLNARVNDRVSLSGSYSLNKAMSNTDGLGTFAANPFNYAGEYGPASTDIRQRVTATGTINLRGNIRISPNFIVQSGPPFDIISGSDPFGTTLFTARPGVGADPSKPGLIPTSYGLLDPNPSPGEKILGRNFGRGPGQINLNVRVGKTFPLGEAKKYNLSISMSVRNILNHLNPGPINGDITSPLFGRANQLAGNLNGEGFSEAASNRRLELQTKFTF